MVSKVTTAEEFLPKRRSLAALRKAAEECRGCELYKDATQTVFGEGLRRARIMLVGEIPGDQEDRQGKPFVGPAGRLLSNAIEEAGISPDDTYLTNAVKHFRWERRGKRRLHKKPSWRQVEACKPWLAAEILVVRPAIVVCLGATAAQSLLGREFRVSKERGEFVRVDRGHLLMATHHPAAILRAPEEAARRQKREELVGDLRLVAERVASSRD
jgi:DNA polymerase